MTRPLTKEEDAAFAAPIALPVPKIPAAPNAETGLQKAEKDAKQTPIAGRARLVTAIVPVCQIAETVLSRPARDATRANPEAAVTTRFAGVTAQAAIR
jgi:hypothetical protein